MTITLREYAIAITLVALAQTSYIAGDLIKNSSDDATRINATALQSSLGSLIFGGVDTSGARAAARGARDAGASLAQTSSTNLDSLSNSDVRNAVDGSGIPNVGNLTDKLGSVAGSNPMSALQNASGGAGDMASKAQSMAGDALGNVDVGGLASKAKDMLGGGSLGPLSGMFPPNYNIGALKSNPATMADVQKCLQENMPPSEKANPLSGVTEMPSGTTDALGAVKGAASNATGGAGNLLNQAKSAASSAFGSAQQTATNSIKDATSQTSLDVGM